MADVEQQQGGPSSSRRRTLTGKSKAQPANDWPRSREPRSRASPRSRRHGGDIDMDIVESSDADANEAQPSSARKQHHHRRRPRLQPPSSTASDTASDTTAPARTPQRSPREKGRPSRSMRRPNVAASAVATAPAQSNHWRPTFTVEEVDDDDDDDAAPSGPSRPVSRQTLSRRDTSSRSAHRYRSTPESRRSPRTSVSDSDDDTEATSESDAGRVVRSRGKRLPPLAPIAPAVPPAPSAAAIHNTVQERLSRPPEMVYEEDGDGTSRYAPSARHRSLSRPASSRRDHYRRPRDITVSGPPSLDETRSRSRSKSARPSRRHYESDVYVSSRPPSSFKRPNAASSYSLSSSKRSNVFGDLAATPVRPSHLDKPAERLTVCASCRNDSVPVSTTVKLKCRHRMCHSCLRNSFKASLADPQHMPPRCCTNDSIPMRYMDNLFDPAFKREWNQKYMEHANRSRLLCASRKCGELIRPEDMRPEGSRWVGRCSRCRVKTCGSCGGKWHHQHDCSRDGEAAQREPWQRCYRCKAVVDIKDGRNRMICHCGAESCSACGGKWKTCDCPWFQYDPLEADAMKSRSNPFVSRPGSPGELRSDFGPVTATAARQRPSSYEEDPYLQRLNEQRDEHLARRMQSFDAFGHHADQDQDRRHYELADTHDSRARRRRTEPRVDYGDPLGDDDYHRRAATVVAPSPPQPHVPAAPPPPHSSFDPPSRPAFDRSVSGFNYASPAHRDRGMRYASPERYDDYVADMYTPDRRRARSPDEWHQQLSQERQPRPRDRRNTFPTESRPASPDTWQQLPTRYPSPERAMPTTEERRRAPSPDKRRASSLEKRLAGRFKAESRQSPAAPTAPVGTVGPVGPGGALGPLTPTRAQPAPSRAATHVGVPMPMAPAPPPAIHGAAPPIASLRRHHTMDEDVYPPPGGMHAGGGIPPPGDWFGPPPGHPHPHAHPHSHAHPIPLAHPHAIPHPHAHPHAHPSHHAHPHSHPPPGVGMLHPMHVENSPNNPNNIMDGSPRAPHVRRRPPPNQTLAQQQAQVLREHSKYDAAAVPPPPLPGRLVSSSLPASGSGSLPAAVLAGLGGPGRGMHRVSEWVNYVEVGMPPEEGLVAGVH